MGTRLFKGGEEGTGGKIPLQVMVSFTAEEAQMLNTVELRSPRDIAVAIENLEDFNLQGPAEEFKLLLLEEVENNGEDYLDVMLEQQEKRELAAIKLRSAARVAARTKRKNEAAELAKA